MGLSAFLNHRGRSRVHHFMQRAAALGIHSRWWKSAEILLVLYTVLVVGRGPSYHARTHACVRTYYIQLSTCAERTHGMLLPVSIRHSQFRLPAPSLSI